MAESPNGDLVLAGSYTYTVDLVGDTSSADTLVGVGANGSADTQFGTSGIVTFGGATVAPGYSALAINPSGQIYLGLANAVTGGSGGVVLKAYAFNGDGSVNTAFGTSGIASTGTISGDGSGLILKIQLNGQIEIGAGGSGTSGHFILAKFNANGTLDISFGTSGIKIGVAEGGGLTMVTAASGEAVLIGKLSGSSGIILQEFNTLATTQTYYAEYDADYNVTSISNSSGGVLERYSYDPYGNVTVGKASGVTLGNGTAAGSLYGWVNLHQGLRFDTTISEYNVRGRDYDVALGRWSEQDPGHYVDGNNTYQFNDSNSVTKVDPYGLQAMTCGVIDGPGSVNNQYEHGNGQPARLSNDLEMKLANSSGFHNILNPITDRLILLHRPMAGGRGARQWADFHSRQVLHLGPALCG